MKPALLETRLDSELRFAGRVVTVTEDRVRLPDGREAGRECVRHPGGVAVLAQTPQGEVILVRQFRYVCGTEVLEVPAGKLDVTGEPPEACALRELAEETPFTARSVRLLHVFYSTPGFCDEKIHLYQAEGVEFGSNLQADDGEFVEVELLNVAQVRQAMADGRIRDGKTLVALYYWLAQQECRGTTEAV